uniref:Uncharacterized protein n=1 Tax=Lactuca sativa TaxID=4236 RepID=A0A9R1WRL7_LACSA|nr:hypothetical protein LSAT_V11C900482410 [Lactuca sativa]
MESKKQESGNPSSSSFTEALFGPKDGGSSSSSSGRFGSVFGPSSTGLAKDTTHCSKYTGTESSNNQDPNGTSASRGNWWQGSLYY